MFHHNRKYLLIIIFLSIFIIALANKMLAASFNIDSLNLQEAAPQSNRPVAYFKVGLKEAWQKINITLGLNLSPITIGIIDTGIDNSHPEFVGVKKGNTPPDALIDRGVFINNRLESHGTNVAGIIGANNISAISSANYVFPQMNGILSGVKNLDYTLENRRYSKSVIGLKTLFSVAKETVELSGTNAKIINLSFTTFNPLGSTIFDSIFNFYSNVLFIVSAGNNNLPVFLQTPANLGNISNVITVGGTTLNDQRESDSNFGPQVGISAPAEFVFSPTFFSEPLDIFDYEDFSGTSASAPMVTGVAGLIKAINPNLSPADIKKILVRNADPIQTDKPIGGRLNALKAVCDPLVGLNCAPTPPPTAPAAWPMLQKNAQRTGLADIAGPPFATSTQVTVKWQKTLDLPSFFPPIISSQAVYVGVGSNLIAFAKNNGNQVWQVNIPAGAVNGALGPDGTIYVCGLNTNQQSVLTAVNPIDGAIKWQFIVGPFRPCNPPVTSQNGVIYTTIPPPLNTQLAVVVAVNPDGTEKWRYEEGNISTTPPALSNDESQVYVGFSSDLKSFNASTGQILWTGNVPFFPFLIAVDPNDRVLTQTLNGPITTFSKAGVQIWQTGNVSAFSLYLQNQILTVNSSSFAIRNASDGSFISGGFWPNGFQLPGNAFPIVDKDGIFYLPLAIFSNPTQIRLFAFDSGGNQRWIFDVTSTLNIAAIGGSALDSDGSLYLVAQKLLLKLGQ